ncbi:MAG: hypothetical protein HS104_42380 [Polyangiaceae bacterium]|nr:hypothetical protein [Polyangiaceae bacterium]MCE7889396.1 hypothetical protein [Sorangiineae bacterium PRO1]MCL4756573.1 HxsD-like protein [Myxococcales bacterium]
MIELRFPSDLYSGEAIDQAVKVYAEHARAELEQTPDAYVVRLHALGDASEGLVADELANYALGATIERRGE